MYLISAQGKIYNFSFPTRAKDVRILIMIKTDNRDNLFKIQLTVPVMQQRFTVVCTRSMQM